MVIPLGWSPAEVRAAAYRRHYASTWSPPDVAAVLSSCPNEMMWDDHEIFDRYGSNDRDRAPAAGARFEATAQPFAELQMPLSPDDRVGEAGFGWLAKHGDVAVLVLDGRSQRKLGNRQHLGQPQLEALELRLDELQRSSSPARRTTIAVCQVKLESRRPLRAA